MSFVDVNNFVVSATEILPGTLWLGNEAAALSPKFINEHGIDFIVNCSKSIPNAFESRVQYVRLPVNDPGPLVGNALVSNDDNLKMSVLIPQAAAAIEDAIRDGKRVLVHCHAGAQRSASVVIFYLMKYANFAVGPNFHNLSGCQKIKTLYKACVNYVVSKRPIVYYAGMHNNFRYAYELIFGCQF